MKVFLRILFALLAVFLLLYFVAHSAWWNQTLDAAARRRLADLGLHAESLRLSFDPGLVRVDEVAIVRPLACRIGSIDIRYGLRTLWKRRQLDRIVVRNADVDWDWTRPREPGVLVPGAWASRAPLPFRSLEIESGMLTVKSPNQTMRLPWTLRFDETECGGYTGVLQLALSPRTLNVGLRADFTNRQWRMEIEAGGLALEADPPLAALIEDVLGWKLAGSLFVSGRVDCARCALRPTIAVRWMNLAMSRMENRLFSGGGAMAFDGLAPWTTPDGQRVDMDELVIKNWTTQNARVDFHLDRQGALFVEKASWSWLGGTFQTCAVPIRRRAGETALELYCEHLSVSNALSAIWPDRVEATGQLYGRLPLRLRWSPEPGLAWGEGYLFAEPGEGYIALHDSGLVRQALEQAAAPDDPTAAEELRVRIRRALRDFAYNALAIRFAPTESGRPAGTLRLIGHGRQEDGVPFDFTLRLSTAGP